MTLLRIGTAMIISAVALALVVAAVLALSGPAEEIVSRAASVEPLSPSAPERETRKFDPGEKLEIDDQPEEETEEKPTRKKPTLEKPAPEEPTREEPTREKPTREKPPAENSETPTPPTRTPAPAENWPAPSTQEVAAAQAPRYYPQREDGVMSLTVEGIGLYDVPVINENTQQALDNGVIHFPQTPMPWEERDQKNVYLAGHRLGWEGTGSRLVFYNLDKLKKEDPIMVRDSLGEPYEYRVSEVFVVEPDADWVVDPVRGRDMLTLQTCTLPDLRNRIIVRADRI